MHQFLSISTLASLASAGPLLTGVPLFTDNGLNAQVWNETGVSVTLKQLHGGQQEGSSLLTISTPKMIVNLAPSRGMNILNVTDLSGNRLGGWDSGVTEVVNPAYLNQMDRAGSGFLSGFNEMVVRCGFEYVGHAGEDGAEGLLTLHGKIANTPVYQGSIRYDATREIITVYAETLERAFKKSYFRSDTYIEISTTSTSLTLRDTLFNEGAYEAEYMALYHSNFGTPILSKDATLHIPARQVSPFNDGARDGLATWDQLLGPTPLYDETVYNIYPHADANNNTIVAMIAGSGTSGIKMEWGTDTLPVLSLWKNLDMEKMGYVVGLEPGTSFSYNRKFQRPLDLVPTIASSASVTFEITYTFLSTKAEVDSTITAINDIQAAGGDTEILPDPLSDEIDETTTDSDSSGKGFLPPSVLALLFAFVVATVM